MNQQNNKFSVLSAPTKIPYDEDEDEISFNLVQQEKQLLKTQQTFSCSKSWTLF